MALFIASYDLVKGRDYTRIINEMKRLGGHKPTESVWLLNLDTDDPVTVRDHLLHYIDADDRLIVARFIGKPAPKNCFNGTNDWIANNVP